MASLTDRKVLLLGAGALGSTIAVKLARTGVGTLTVVDRDVLEPGNLERHACTILHLGVEKSTAVCALVRQAAPYVEARPYTFHIGGGAGGAQQRKVLAEEIAAADIVVDATAEVGIQRLTSHLARQCDTPWVMAAASNGAWAARSFVSPPDRNGAIHASSGTAPKTKTPLSDRQPTQPHLRNP